MVIYLTILVASAFVGAKMQSTTAINNQSAVTDATEFTTSIEKSIHAWVDSVMFEHMLKWEGNASSWNYTVYLRHQYGDEKWEAVPSCSYISATQCNLTDKLHVFITYEIQVKREEWSSEIITFCAEFDTKLLPPRFKLSRMRENIFIRPITDEFKQNWEDLMSYHYEVQYWPKQFPNEISFMTFRIDDTEAPIEDLNPKRAYCFSLRFFNSEYINCTSESSDWTKELCINASSIDDVIETSTPGVAKWIVTSCAIFFIGVVCLGWMLCTTYRKIRKHDEILPDYLNVVKEEMKDSNRNINQSSHSVSEIVDRIYVDNSDMKLDHLANEIHQSIVNEDWAHVMQESDVIQSNGFDGDSEIASAPPTPPNTRQFSRSRSRSRGYHSFSSGDVVGDDNTPLALGTYVDLEYANANTLLTSALKCNEEKPFLTKSNLQLSTSSSEKTTTTFASSDYLNMNKHYEGDPFRAFASSQNIKDAALQRPGHAPYENLTYCSQQYGNVPDAFVFPNT